MKVRTTLLFASLTLSGAVDAGYPHTMNAGVLRADCELLDRPSQVRCEAYLMGIVDMVNALSFSGKLVTTVFCTPEGITEIRLRKSFVEYVAAEHVAITDPAADVAIAAFTRAFPCK
jgi:hypothetical protein